MKAFNSLLSLTALLLLCSEARALEWLSVQVPAQYESGMAIPDSIRNGCTGLDRTVGTEVAYQLEKNSYAKIDRIERLNPKLKGAQLALTITQAAASKGQWTDPKSLTLKAELLQEGKSIEWTTKTRTSRSQLDVCETMEKNAADIGLDIYKWLVESLKSKTLPANLMEAATASSPGLRELQSHTLWINNTVTYELEISGRQLVTQCNIEESLVNNAREEFSRSLPVKTVKKTAEAGADEDLLQFTIVEIKGSIDNAPEKRGMILKADVLRNGAVVDSFTAPRKTEKAGLFGQVIRNTCDALNDIGKTMVSDTYQWYVKRGTVPAAATSSAQTSVSSAP